MKNILLKFGLILLAGAMAGGATQAANVNFNNATVTAVEVRTAAMGAMVVIGLKDSAGNQISHLCDVAGNLTALSIPNTDPAAPGILAVALAAKATGKTVTGWGLDNSGGSFCGIGNLAI